MTIRCQLVRVVAATNKSVNLNKTQLMKKERDHTNMTVKVIDNNVKREKVRTEREAEVAHESFVTDNNGDRRSY